MISAEANSGIYRKQSLHASVIRACAKCGAPGYWHNTPGVNVGCYAPEKVTQLGQDPVGKKCPNCGAKRSSVVEDRGEVWHKYYGSRLARLMAELQFTLRRMFQ